MAEYPALASLIKSQLGASFQNPSDDTLGDLTAGTSDPDVQYAVCSFVVLHLLWVTRLEAYRRVDKITVWKNVVDWKGVFEAHIHLETDKRTRRGAYVERTPSSYTAIVKISPPSAKQDGTFVSELTDWSASSRPLSAVDGKFKTNGKNRFELRPNALRPFRDNYMYDYEYEDPDKVEVET
jgi:hypothetical protein